MPTGEPDNTGDPEKESARFPEVSPAAGARPEADREQVPDGVVDEAALEPPPEPPKAVDAPEMKAETKAGTRVEPEAAAQAVIRYHAPEEAPETSKDADPLPAPPAPGASSRKPPRKTSAGEPAGTDVRPEDPRNAEDVSPEEMPGHEDADAGCLRSRAGTRAARFAVAAAAAAVGYGLYRGLEHSPEDDMQPVPTRRALERRVRPEAGAGAEGWRLQLVGVAEAQLHSNFTRDVTAWEYRYQAADPGEDKGHDTRVAPATPSASPPVETAEKMAPARMLTHEKAREGAGKRTRRGQEEAGESRSTLPLGTPGLLLTMDDIRTLPRQELVTQFKCIEGWSQIVHWAGVRMAAFLEAYSPEAARPGFSAGKRQTRTTTPAMNCAIAGIRKRCL